MADYVKRVNQQLSGGGARRAVVPASAVARPGTAGVRALRRGRRELERVVSTRLLQGADLGEAGVDQLGPGVRGDRSGRARGDGGLRRLGITTTVTGSGRIFATLDHYLVVSQLSSFATAFVTVFGVIFLVFRSARFGVLGIVANALPVAAVLGLMGWLGISLNIATVMVASVALGIVDDDTIHFIGRFRREAAAGATTERRLRRPRCTKAARR